MNARVDLAIDLGAGPRAEVASQVGLQGARRWLALDPVLTPSRSSGIDAIHGSLACIKTGVAQLVLFNPPTVPRRFLSRIHPQFAYFNAGDHGLSVLKQAMPETMRVLSSGGVLLVVWPSYHPPPERHRWQCARVATFAMESFADFAARAPTGRSQKGLFVWLKSRACLYRRHWKDIGVYTAADKFAITLWEFQAP